MLKYFMLKDKDGMVKPFPIAEVMAGWHDEILTFPKSYLAMVADERPWDGKPHVTDLLNGPRYTFLKATTDYAIAPESAAFRVMGIQAHKKLDGFGETSELALENDDVIGRSDLLEPNGDGTFTLTDYKIVGSYKVMKALGIYYETVNLVGPDGKPEVFKSGARAGQQKTKKELRVDPSKVDVKDWTRQLNIYRHLAQTTLGVKVTRLQIFAIVRDANTVAASSRGVKNETYLVKIPIFSDETVSTFIKQRSEELMAAFNGATPRECDDGESWEGRRCKGFCEVASTCRNMGCTWLNKPDEEEEAE